jgi:hypothetical protein
MVERQTVLPRGHNAFTTHATLRVYRRPLSNIVTTILREREGRIAVILGETSSEARGGDRGRGS